MSKKSGSSAPRAPMTLGAAARIQSKTARSHGGQVPAGSFAARAQAASVKNSGGNGQ